MHQLLRKSYDNACCHVTAVVSAAKQLDFCSCGAAGASMVKRPASALDNPVRDSPSSTASQRAKVILNTPTNGVSAGEVRCMFGLELEEKVAALLP